MAFMELADRLDDPSFDPDGQKVTESVPHRTTVELIALAATRALAGHDELQVVCDLNWYPVEDRSVYLAPDVMVVQRSAVGPRAKSYRQTDGDAGPPLVALEVPSDTNTVSAFAAKLRRINSYGVVAYVVDVDPEAQAVLRYEAPSIAPSDWAGRAIPELGGIVLDFVDDALTATLPDGISATDPNGMVTALIADANRRAEELADRLRALGHDPDADPAR